MTYNTYFFLHLFQYVYNKVVITGSNLKVTCLKWGHFVPTLGPLHFYIEVLELF